MRPTPTPDALRFLLEALGRSEQDPATRRVVEALGGDPVVRERRVGEPGYLSRRLVFAAGGEVFLHDGSVVAVRLDSAARRLPGVSDDATLDELSDAVGSRPRFAGFGAPYFALDNGFLRAVFRDNRGWKERGNLVALILTAAQPGLANRPEDDDCPACADLLVRSADGAMDVDATAAALASAVAADVLREDAHWVRLADLLPLRASGLMQRPESQLRCRTCSRILCLTLPRDGAPTLAYEVLNDAQRRPMDPVPPVELWGDPDRIAREAAAMQYVDHEPGMWFLVRQGDALYLDTRYSYSAAIDDSALLLLDDAERHAYAAGGHEYLTTLSRKVHDSAPYREHSPYYARDLYRRGGRGDPRRYRDEVTAAIMNHTWIARQRAQR